MIGRAGFLRFVAFFGAAPALVFSSRTKSAGASVNARPLPVAVSEPADNALFYIAGWETPDSAADGMAGHRIAIRIDRAWRAVRY